MNIKAVVFDAYVSLYDIQSVAACVTEEEHFPGLRRDDHASVAHQAARIYLAALADADATRISPSSPRWIARLHALRVLGPNIARDAVAFERIMDKYLHLDPYPDALAALAAMRDRKLAILSNGSTAMLNALVANSGLDRVLNATISVDSKKISQTRARRPTA